ncbi:MAG: hypothetical protein IJ507_06660 [Clostridia bacterium]|nr:hypothetical protein [Clostridia bacterium]
MKRFVCLILAACLLFSCALSVALAKDEEIKKVRKVEDTNSISSGAKKDAPFALTREAAAQYEGMLAAGQGVTVAISSDGALLVTGGYSIRSAVEEWTGITRVRNSLNGLIGLRADGTFEGYVYELWGYGRNGADVYGTLKSKNVVDVALGGYQTAGLISDGTVTRVGSAAPSAKVRAKFVDVVKVTASSNGIIAGLTKDGTVLIDGLWDAVCTRYDDDDWHDIVDAEFANEVLVGLKKDGTVIYTSFTVEDTTRFPGLGEWTDIVAISVNQSLVLGLKSDGTVVATGDNENGECNVSSWTEIVAVAAGSSHSVGLKKDGTLVTAGSNGVGQCDVSEWKLW